MIDGIQAKPVAEVGPIMADVLNKDWCRDRKEVLEYINKFREYLYLLYNDIGLFDDKTYCLEVEKFPVECGNICDCGRNFYYGVTLPSDIDGVVAVWEDSQPLKIYSKWWEAREGIVTAGKNGCASMAVLLVPGTFPTQRALECPSRLAFYSTCLCDDNKVIVLDATTSSDERKEFRVKLVGDGVVKIDEKIKEIHSVILPQRLSGAVNLSEDDGICKQVAEFDGYETVPAFKRIKFTNLCRSKRIALVGTQKFRPVFFDYDIVEVGSRLILEAAARMFKYGDSGTSADEIKRSQLDQSKLETLLLGALGRKRGKAGQEPSSFNKNRVGRIARLPGY